MKICMIGTGYVGLVTGTCFAESGNDVICVDIDESKVARLNQGQVPIYEPGLEELIERNRQEGRLSFTTDLKAGVEQSYLIFIAVGTPPGEDGSSDLRYVLQAARDIGRFMDGPKIIVNKSTVPVGTSELVRQEVSSQTSHPFEVVSNPEFLKEGAAIEDFMSPDRIVVGTESEEAEHVMRDLYAPFTRRGPRMLVMDTRSSEMTKYAANAMLACRISFMNEMAGLCERMDADIEWVRRGIGSDHRIGTSFLFPGVGYGGSCFPKDVQALVRMGQQNHYPMSLAETIESVNRNQKLLLVRKIDGFFSSGLLSRMEECRSAEGRLQWSQADLERIRKEALGSTFFPADKPPQASDLKGRTFAVWGLSFKPKTGDLRQAPSLTIIRELLLRGASIQAYDPQAMPEARGLLDDSVAFYQNNYDALDGADALILITEWNLFRTPDFAKMKRRLKSPLIFDGRNQYQPEEMLQAGFLYLGIGRR